MARRISASHPRGECQRADGADDPYVPQAGIAAMEQELKAAGVDYYTSPRLIQLMTGRPTRIT
jgi:hypothetical protein